MKIRPLSPWFLALGAFAMLPIIQGCGSMSFASETARNRQIALTGLMAIDTAQTVTIARSPECLYEANPVAAAVFGSKTPSPERVLITNALYVTGHWALASYLDRRAEAGVDLSVDAAADLARQKRWKRLRGIYQFVTAIGHGAAVVNNEARGIRPFSSFRCN